MKNIRYGLRSIQQFLFFFFNYWLYFVHNYVVKILRTYIKGKNDDKAQMISRISYGYSYPQ